MAALFLALTALCLHQARAQWPMGLPGMGFQPRFGNMGNQMGGNSLWGSQGVFNRRYATCQSMSGNGDGLAVTLTEENNGMSNWGMGMRMSATITSVSVTGSFQLALSQFGRIENGCWSSAIGSIYGPRMANNNFWSSMMPFGQQNQQAESGILGSPFTIQTGQTASLSEVLSSDLQFDRVIGSAVMLCQTQSVANGQCMDPIYLCCKLGKDIQPAQQYLGTPNSNIMGAGAIMQNFGVGGNLAPGLSAGMTNANNLGNNLGTNLGTGLGTNLGTTGLTGGLGTNLGTNTANSLPLSGNIFSGK